MMMSGRNLDMTETDSNSHDLQPGNDWAVFAPALFLIVILSAGLILYPDGGASYSAAAMDFITHTLGWLYLVLGASTFAFAMWLAFGRYGQVLLGEPGESPEYSNLHWISMMFTAGVGGGMIAWGVAEPLSYLQQPPFGITPHSALAFEWAHAYPIFHWGILAWAIYAVPAVPVAYMLYVQKVPTMKISGVCQASFLAARHPIVSPIIDIIVALAIVGGAATTLGLGVPLVSALLSELFGVSDGFGSRGIVLLLWACIFGGSAYRGLRRGIKILADINMVLAILALLFVLLAGPTLFILKLTVNSIGLVVDNFLRMAFWTDPIDQSGFPQSWTIFYWAWWAAFAPFVGLFFGRISRGRTIRQLVLGVIGWGTLGTCSFLVVMGGYALHLVHSDALPLAEIFVREGMGVATVQVIAQLSGGKLALGVFLVLSIIFYATTMDSAAYTIASVCSKDLRSDREPPRLSRIIWAFALVALTLALVATERLKIVQASTVVFSLPLLPVLVLMCMSLVKWLRTSARPAAP